MNPHPAQDELERALRAAGHAHHEYEQNALGGSLDKQWPAWYAAYVLGRLGDFTLPSLLTSWLEGIHTEKDWFSAAAEAIYQRLRPM